MPWLLRTALAEPKLSLDIVESFANHDHPAVRHAVALHPALVAAPDLIATLSKDEDFAVRGAVAFRSDASPEALTALTRDPIANVVEIALWNDHTPTLAITRLIFEGRSDLMLQLARVVDRLPSAAKELLTSHPWYRAEPTSWPAPGFIDPDGKQRIASRSFRYDPTGGHRRFHPNAPTYDVWIAGAYAHPSFPVPVLPAYVDEHWGNGGRELSSHPWLDEKLMEHLAAKREPEALNTSTRAKVAQHPRIPIALLEELANESWKNILQSVAKNPHVPLSILEKLAGSSEGDVREEVATNVRTPISLLTKLAKDPEVGVRRAVAANAASPLSLVDSLSADASEYVGAVVLWTKKARSNLNA